MIKIQFLACTMGMSFLVATQQLGANQTGPDLTGSLPIVRTAASDGFTKEQCYKKHFPLALQIPEGAIPPEVQFYCAAPWNKKAFESVRKALVNKGYNIVEATVRRTPQDKQGVLRQTMSMAKAAAEGGPDGMGAVWYAQQTLPWLYAIKFKTKDELFITKAFHPSDVTILRAAALAINWQQAALDSTPLGNPVVQGIFPKMKLADVTTVIMTNKFY